MNKEEKAKEYNSWRKFISDYQIWTPALDKACKIAERQGFNKENKDLSTQLTAYKEALREIVECTNDMENAKTDLEYNIRSAERKITIAKAKKLTVSQPKEESSPNGKCNNS